MTTPIQPLAAAALTTVPNTPQAVTDIDDPVLKTDTRPIIRLGFWVLIVGFGLFLLWAAFAPLDEGVSAPALVSLETRRKTVQHLQGGVVKQVNVKEGSEVKQGDVLISLDDAATRAGYESIRQNYLAQRALEGRLMAEASGVANISFHPDLLAQASDTTAQQHMAVQRQLFASRRGALAAELGAGRQSIAGMEEQIVGAQRMRDSRVNQASLQSRQLAGVKALADDGYAPRNQALQLEQSQAELQTALVDLDNQVQRTRSGIAELRLRMTQRQQEYLKETSGQLSEVRREVLANQERLLAITEDLSRMQIRSPAAGQVIGLAVNGIGGVVSPGQHLMDIVPRGESLLLDARVPTQVIDRVKAGDETEVRFTGFANSPQLVVQGKVVSLSGDAVSDPAQQAQPSPAFYLARVEITPQGLKSLGDRVMQPGMQAEVLIRTGERSLLTYLLHPLIKRVKAAMIEE